MNLNSIPCIKAGRRNVQCRFWSFYAPSIQELRVMTNSIAEA
jgi:hypothetical protein